MKSGMIKIRKGLKEIGIIRCFMKKIALLNDTTNGNHHGCEVVIKTIISLIEKNNGTVIGTVKCLDDWNTDYGRELIEESDIVVVNGEGTIHHDREYAKILVSVADYCYGKKPCYLINSSIQSCGSDIINNLKKFDKIFVREGMSHDELKEQGIDSVVVSDMTFYHSYNITGNHLYNIGYTDSVYKESSEKLLALSRKKGDIFLPALKDKVPKNNFRKIKNKLTVMKVFIKKLLGLKLTYKQEFRTHHLKNESDYIQKMNDCEIVVAARFHSMCLCIQSHCPFIAVRSNTFKVESILRDIGICESRFCNDVEDSLVLLERMGGNYSFSENESKKIYDYCSKSKQRIEEMMSEIIS